VNLVIPQVFDEECASPYYLFKKRLAEIVLASPSGGATY
jgi:putative intracellular protease/amidase